MYWIFIKKKKKEKKTVLRCSIDIVPQEVSVQLIARHTQARDKDNSRDRSRLPSSSVPRKARKKNRVSFYRAISSPRDGDRPACRPAKRGPEAEEQLCVARARRREPSQRNQEKENFGRRKVNPMEQRRRTTHRERRKRRRRRRRKRRKSRRIDSCGWPWFIQTLFISRIRPGKDARFLGTFSLSGPLGVLEI